MRVSGGGDDSSSSTAMPKPHMPSAVATGATAAPSAASVSSPRRTALVGSRGAAVAAGGVSGVQRNKALANFLLLRGSEAASADYSAFEDPRMCELAAAFAAWYALFPVCACLGCCVGSPLIVISHASLYRYATWNSQPLLVASSDSPFNGHERSAFLLR